MLKLTDLKHMITKAKAMKELLEAMEDDAHVDAWSTFAIGKQVVFDVNCHKEGTEALSVCLYRLIPPYGGSEYHSTDTSRGLAV